MCGKLKFLNFMCGMFSYAALISLGAGLVFLSYAQWVAGTGLSICAVISYIAAMYYGTKADKEREKISKASRLTPLEKELLEKELAATITMAFVSCASAVTKSMIKK